MKRLQQRIMFTFISSTKPKFKPLLSRTRPFEKQNHDFQSGCSLFAAFFRPFRDTTRTHFDNLSAVAKISASRSFYSFKDWIILFMIPTSFLAKGMKNDINIVEMSSALLKPLYSSLNSFLVIYCEFSFNYLWFVAEHRVFLSLFWQTRGKVSSILFCWE